MRGTEGDGHVYKNRIISSRPTNPWYQIIASLGNMRRRGGSERRKESTEIYFRV